MLNENNGLWRMAIFSAAAMVMMSVSGAASGYTEKTLYSFCSVKKCHDGSQPFGGLVMDRAGNLYGTTLHGGPYAVGGSLGDGVVYEFAPATGQYTTIYNFCSLTICADGKDPSEVKLIIDTNGNLYGTTTEGGNSSVGLGVVFELERTQAGWVEEVLHAFCPNLSKNCKDAGVPNSGLTYAGASTGQPYDGTSALFGTTSLGGTHDQGAVYVLMPKQKGAKWSEKVLYSFCSLANCADGEQPQDAPYLDEAGNLYGTTELGGQFNPQGGTVFELSPNGEKYTETTLYSFCAQTNCTDGKEPYSGMIMDGAGNLIGTASNGGGRGRGLIFELSPNGSRWRYNTRVDFNGKNGSYPASDLMLDLNGNVFGTASGGGTNGKGGAVFEFNGAVQTIYSFCAVRKCLDGKIPFAGVIEDNAGNFYGATSAGGSRDRGTIYELSP
ncbi:MAG TPA: choice-of-anchor tandem repeat GloVer-containing protein [Rhizomicrobium sp.]|jgi:uncharacterized repeat protein (TIGR03803 family)